MTNISRRISIPVVGSVFSFVLTCGPIFLSRENSRRQYSENQQINNVLRMFDYFF